MGNESNNRQDQPRQDGIDPSQSDQQIPNDLFENYEPRSIRKIVEQRNQLRDSEAAEAAAIILEDAEPLELDYESPEIRSDSNDPKAKQLLYRANIDAQRRQQTQSTSLLRLLHSPGAQFVYALLIIAALGGIIGLAATIESPTLVLIAGIASPILLPICIWKWIRWLDSTPYYYRLLTSLGEDARNLLDYRLLWKRNRSAHRTK